MKSDTLQKAIDSLPALPGVYLFKDATNTIIYVGKAKELRKRVASYFQKKSTDWKIAALVGDITSIEHIVTPHEEEALLLEAKLVQQYQPKYNVLLKSGQPFLYILFTTGAIPTIEIVRNKKKKGDYFGPFIKKQQVRTVYEYLLKTFKLRLCNKKLEHGCLDYHLGICPGSCRPDFVLDDYLFSLELAKQALSNQQQQFIDSIKTQVAQHSQRLAFEKARNLNAYLHDVDGIFSFITSQFSARNYTAELVNADLEKPQITAFDTLAQALQELVGTPHAIHTIDCFDVSHFQSRCITGSCIRFIDGIPAKNKFRRFQVKTIEIQDDYAALREIVSRRYRHGTDYPDLVLIDGGKGQLSSVEPLLPNVPCVALAKREERLYSKNHPDGIQLNVHDDTGKTLIALRDYAHHFAVSYHRLKRTKEA